MSYGSDDEPFLDRERELAALAAGGRVETLKLASVALLTPEQMGAVWEGTGARAPPS